MRPATNLVPFVLAFVTAKGAAFLGMLMLGRYAEPELYGTIEAALAAGLIGASIGLLGTTGAVTRLVLVDRAEEALSVLPWAVSVVGCISVGVALAAAYWEVPELTLAAMLVPITAAQFAAGAYFRITGRRVATAISDTLAVSSVVAVAAVVGLALDALTLSSMVVGLASAAVAATAGATVVALRHRINWVVTGTALVLGGPIMASDLLGQLLTQAGRLSLLYTGGVEDVAVYSAIFRLSAGIALIHQLLWGAFYAKLYVLAQPELDRVYSRVVIMFTIVASVLAAVVYMARDDLFPQYSLRTDLPELIPVVVAQVVQWICFAMLIIRVQKQAQGLRAAAAIAAVLLGGAAVLVGWSSLAATSAEVLMNAYLVSLLVVNLSLCWILAKVGEPLPMTSAAVVVSICVSRVGGW